MSEMPKSQEEKVEILEQAWARAGELIQMYDKYGKAIIILNATVLQLPKAVRQLFQYFSPNSIKDILFPNNTEELTGVDDLDIIILTNLAVTLTKIRAMIVELITQEGSDGLDEFLPSRKFELNKRAFALFNKKEKVGRIILTSELKLGQPMLTHSLETLQMECELEVLPFKECMSADTSDLYRVCSQIKRAAKSVQEEDGLMYEITSKYSRSFRFIRYVKVGKEVCERKLILSAGDDANTSTIHEKELLESLIESGEAILTHLDDKKRDAMGRALSCFVRVFPPHIAVAYACAAWQRFMCENDQDLGKPWNNYMGSWIYTPGFQVSRVCEKLRQEKEPEFLGFIAMGRTNPSELLFVQEDMLEDVHKYWRSQGATVRSLGSGTTVSHLEQVKEVAIKAKSRFRSARLPGKPYQIPKLGGGLSLVLEQAGLALVEEGGGLSLEEESN